MADSAPQPTPESDRAPAGPQLEAVESEVWPPLAERPEDCWVCVRIARRWARLGRTISSALAVGAAGGVTLTFLVASPNLRADQWLAILLALQILRTAMWACVWMAARRLQLRGPLFPPTLRGVIAWVAPFFLVFGLLQSAYSIAAFPDHKVLADSETWWWMVANGIGWGLIAVLVRELFFQELLEEFPPPRMWGPGSPEGIETRREAERRHAMRHAGPTQPSGPHPVKPA